jgi:putative transposase
MEASADLQPAAPTSPEWRLQPTCNQPLTALSRHTIDSTMRTPPLRRNPHHPPHWFADDTWYALTSCTYRRLTLLKSDDSKAFLRDKLEELAIHFGVTLAGWAILDNHYHLLAKLTEGKLLTPFVQRLHGSTSYEFNRRDGVTGRRVWQNYWDTCIRDEAGYWTRLNYIHHNPVKHGLVKEMGDYAFSSYGQYLKLRGEDWVADVMRAYPVRDFTDMGDVG